MPSSADAALQKMSHFETLLVGVASGTIEVTILQPMLYCKNATQQGLPFTLDPRVLYRGLFMSVGNMAILTGLQFPLTGAVQKVFTGGEIRKLSKGEQIGSGFIGGAISGFACAPMELVMIQQQRFGTSLLGTPAKIITETGLSGIFRGLFMSCGREGLFTAGYLGLGPVATQTLQDEYGFGEVSAKMGGAVCGGVIAASCSHPLDTIKTCMQGDIARKQYGTVSETAAQLLKEGGMGRFFNGWSWRTSRMILALFLMNECKVRLSPLFFPHHFK